MQQVTVGTKYQIVIPKEIRRRMKAIQPGAKLSLRENEGKITIEPLTMSWVERTSGIMTDYWKKIDPISELENMKDEWEERVDNQSKVWKATSEKPK